MLKRTRKRKSKSVLKAPLNDAKEKSKEGRVHRRGPLYMVTTPRLGAVLNQKQLPIYWRKSMAKSIAEKINGKVVKVELTW
jgi:hypothetical protein